MAGRYMWAILRARKKDGKRTEGGFSDLGGLTAWSGGLPDADLYEGQQAALVVGTKEVIKKRDSVRFPFFSPPDVPA